MTLLIDILGGALFLGGVFFMLVAAVGTLKLPDVYCRSHGVGKAMTLGVTLLLLALGLTVESVAWWKVVLAIIFQFATIPVASHLFCLVAYRKKVRHWSAKGWVRS
ncbi:MAG: monovalent cation/H(+) antiporter subunit G [Verrucomicrobiota bacterium]